MTDPAELQRTLQLLEDASRNSPCPNCHQANQPTPPSAFAGFGSGNVPDPNTSLFGLYPPQSRDLSDEDLAAISAYIESTSPQASTH